MNQNLVILANFLAKVYFPKKIKAISSKEILKEINIRLDNINLKLGTSFKSEIKDNQLRDMINYIRSNNLCTKGEICANSNGYFISKYKEDVLDQIESMERRISGIKNAIDGMRRNVKNYENKPQENAKVVYNSKVPAGDLWDTL